MATPRHSSAWVGSLAAPPFGRRYVAVPFLPSLRKKISTQEEHCCIDRSRTCDVAQEVYPRARIRRGVCTRVEHAACGRSVGSRPRENARPPARPHGLLEQSTTLRHTTPCRCNRPSPRQTLKFGIGDGHLQYYLFNWRCKEITPEEVGLVLL